MNDDDLRLAPAGASDAECAVCLHKTFNRVAVGDGHVPICSAFCLQAWWPRTCALLVDADTARKAGKAWEGLYNERNRLWREAEDRLDAVRRLLEQNGCDCDCEHGPEDHTGTCEMCFPCRVSAAVSPSNVPALVGVDIEIALRDARSEAHAAAKENDAMLLTIEKLSAELAKPEDVRLREAVDAMGDRCPQFFSLAGCIDRLLDDVDEWIGRAGSAERTVEEQGRLLARTQNIVRELQSAPKGGTHVDVLHRRIDALVAIAEAAEELCGVVGERAADGDFNPLPQASLTGAVREEIAPHVFRQWAAAKAALHRADVPPEVHESGWQWRPTDPDTAFAPPFGTIRVCRACGCLVAGGPTACSRCVAVEGAKR